MELCAERTLISSTSCAGMMPKPLIPNLEEVYTADWLKRVEAMERGSALTMAHTIAHELRPTSVLDLGAGPCTHANALAACGCEVVAVDGSVHAAGFAAPAVQFILADLTRPLHQQRTFDVVLCLEVAEHIPEEAEDILCETMTRHTERWLIATAAPPGQKGRRHVNLKPLALWIAELSALGLRHEREMVARWQAIWRSANVRSYFVDNLMIFSQSE